MSVKLHFEISEEEYNERYKPYIKRFKDRHSKAAEAFNAWVNRMIGNDRKRRKELLLSDMELLRPIIQKMIDSGELLLP